MKLSRFWMLIAASTLASGAWARDITTVTGEVFHNAAVTKVQANGIRIVYDDGAGFVDFQILTDQERKDFGFNPDAYAAAEKDEAAFQKRERELRLQAAQVALIAAKKAAETAALYPPPYPPYPPYPYPYPWPPMDSGYQTPDYSYDAAWYPSVPSTYYNNGYSGFGRGFRGAYGGSFGGHFGGGASLGGGGRR